LESDNPQPNEAKKTIKKKLKRLDREKYLERRRGDRTIAQLYFTSKIKTIAKEALSNLQKQPDPEEDNSTASEEQKKAEALQKSEDLLNKKHQSFHEERQERLSNSNTILGLKKPHITQEMTKSDQTQNHNKSQVRLSVEKIYTHEQIEEMKKLGFDPRKFEFKGHDTSSNGYNYGTNCKKQKQTHTHTNPTHVE
jgi:hypothetical protein